MPTLSGHRDFGSYEHCAFARTSKDERQLRRLLALAAILDGGSRSEAARIAGVTLEIVRDRVRRFNEAGISGLATRETPGPSTILDDHHCHALADIIDAGPIPAVHDVVRCHIIDLVQWLWGEFDISISKQAYGRQLRNKGYLVPREYVICSTNEELSGHFGGRFTAPPRFAARATAQRVVG